MLRGLHAFVRSQWGLGWGRAGRQHGHSGKFVTIHTWLFQSPSTLYSHLAVSGTGLRSTKCTLSMPSLGSTRAWGLTQARTWEVEARGQLKGDRVQSSTGTFPVQGRLTCPPARPGIRGWDISNMLCRANYTPPATHRLLPTDGACDVMCHSAWVGAKASRLPSCPATHPPSHRRCMS